MNAQANVNCVDICNAQSMENAGDEVMKIVIFYFIFIYGAYLLCQQTAERRTKRKKKKLCISDQMHETEKTKSILRKSIKMKNISDKLY